jgi:hypothetical protein
MFINKVVQKTSDVVLITLSHCFLLPLLFVLCCIQNKGNDVRSLFTLRVTQCMLLDYKCLQGKRGQGEGIQSNLCLRIKIQFINHLNAFGRMTSAAVTVKKKQLCNFSVDMRVEACDRQLYAYLY